VREIVTAEIMGTALLVFVVYAAVDSERAGRVIHIGALGPLAIGARARARAAPSSHRAAEAMPAPCAGAAVFAAHLALIPIDGTSINPARSLGAALVHGQWRQQWCFWCAWARCAGGCVTCSRGVAFTAVRGGHARRVGPLVGAAVAAVFYELCLKGRPDKQPQASPEPEKTK
jgi:glycerol uptake facilitator-like aquaporin